MVEKLPVGEKYWIRIHSVVWVMRPSRCLLLDGNEGRPVAVRYVCVWDERRIQVCVWRDSATKQLIVAFRGTEAWKDLLTDANFLLVRRKSGVLSCRPLRVYLTRLLDGLDGGGGIAGIHDTDYCSSSLRRRLNLVLALKEHMNRLNTFVRSVRHMLNSPFFL